MIRLRRTALVSALIGMLLSVAWVMPAAATTDCPEGQTQFKIDSAPGNGTYGDGTLEVTISNAKDDSFSWSSNIDLESVIVKGGPVTKTNPGGTSGTAYSPDNPNNGQRYGVSHVSFCYEEGAAASKNGDTGDKNESNAPKASKEECAGAGKMGHGHKGEDCGGGSSDECTEKNMGPGNSSKHACDSDDEEEVDNPAGSGGSGNDRGSRHSGSNDSDGPSDSANGAGDQNGAPGSVESEAQASDQVEGKIISNQNPGLLQVGGSNQRPGVAPEVEGAREAAAPGQVLPFTGSVVAVYVLLGLGLVAAGLAVRRVRRT